LINKVKNLEREFFIVKMEINILGIGRLAALTDKEYMPLALANYLKGL
jgi:hypothetical protein